MFKSHTESGAPKFRLAFAVLDFSGCVLALWTFVAVRFGSQDVHSLLALTLSTISIRELTTFIRSQINPMSQ
jgi:hypothetical protein